MLARSKAWPVLSAAASFFMLGASFACAPSAENSRTDAPAVETRSIEIIVLGSSTAAGKNLYKAFGKPKSDEQQYATANNWTAVLGARLKNKGGMVEIVNLGSPAHHSTSAALDAKPGSALYKSSLRYALEQWPHADAMIVNFPAVRADDGESVETVIENLRALKTQAEAAGVGKVWIATSQPVRNARACLDPQVKSCPAAETVLRSRIDLTQAIKTAFPDDFIDFYGPLAKGGKSGAAANPALLIDGDPQHPNVPGHEALAQAVIDAGVYEDALSRR